MTPLTLEQLTEIISRIHNVPFHARTEERQHYKIMLVVEALRANLGLISSTEEEIARVLREMIAEGKITL